MPQDPLLSLWMLSQAAVVAIAVGLQFRRVWRVSGHADRLRFGAVNEEGRDLDLITIAGVALILIDVGFVATYGFVATPPSFSNIVPQLLVCPMLAMCLALVFEGAVTGRVWSLSHRPDPYQRDQEPTRYWFAMAVYGLLGIASLLCVVAFVGVLG